MNFNKIKSIIIPEGEVSVIRCKEQIIWKKRAHDADYLWIENTDTATGGVTWNKTGSPSATIQYSYDKNNWNNVVFDQPIPLNVNQKVYFKGNNSSFNSNNLNYINLSTTMKRCAAGGDVTTLLNEEGNVLNLIPYGDGVFSYLFSSCKSLTTAPSLPSTTLASNCYKYMFASCASLATAPVLPAETLAIHCYEGMFISCASLATAPELPATALANYCYNYMFYSCTALTTAPELPATALTNYCYYNMFYGCTALTTAPSLPSTTLAIHCYGSMFRNCTGLTTAPELPATTLVSQCYYDMFYGCTSLTTAPDLPATTLVSQCYNRMFYGCRSLNYIKAMFLTTPSISYTDGWTREVSSTGTFVKNAAATWNDRGVYAIPNNWNVETV